MDSNVLAVGQISLKDLNDAIISDVRPANPHKNQLWIDESVTPAMIKKWTGTHWKELGELDPDLSHTISEIHKTLGNMADDDKLDVQERQIIKDRLVDITGKIIKDIDTSLPTYDELLANEKGSLFSAVLSATYAGLQGTELINNLKSKYQNLRNYLQNMTPIKPWDTSDKNKDTYIDVDKSQFRNVWLEYYRAIEVLMNESSKKVRDNIDGIREDFDNLEIGGRNLVEKSNEILEWGKWGSNTNVSRTSTGIYRVSKTNPDLTNAIGVQSDGEFTLNKGQDYTLSFDSYSYYGGLPNYLYILSRDKGNTVLDRNNLRVIGKSNTKVTDTTYTDRYELTFTFNKDTITDGKVLIGFSGSTGNNPNIGFYLTNVKLEKGNKATDWTPAPEDVEREAKEYADRLKRETTEDINNVSKQMSDLDNFIKTSFKDGIISEAEASSIATYINLVNTEKANVDNRYNAVINESDLVGTAKTNLTTAKNAYNSAHSNLITSINNAIADGKITDAERMEVNNRFNLYRNALSTLSRRFEEAINAIAQNKIDKIEVSERNIILNSNTKRSSTSYLVYGYYMSEDWELNTEYTIVIKGSINSGQKFGVWANGSSTRVTYLNYDSKSKLYIATFKTPSSINTINKKRAYVYNYPSTGAQSATIEWIKLVKGNKTSMSWLPAPEDTQLQLDDLVNRVTDAEFKIEDDRIVSLVTGSETYRGDFDGVNNNIDNLMKRMTNAEQKILPDAIISTVTGSTKYLGDLEDIRRSFGNLVKNPAVTNSTSGWSGSGLSTATVDFQGVSTRVLRSVHPEDTQNFSDWFDVDPSKAYEISFWVKKSSREGKVSLGVDGRDRQGNSVGFTSVNKQGNIDNLNNTYFNFYESFLFSPIEWIKVVGYIMPAGTNPKDLIGLGTSNNFNAIIKPTAKEIRVRWENFDNAGIDRTVWVANPKVVEVSSDMVGRTAEASSKISQLENEIDLRVKTKDYNGNEIVSMLNLNSTTFKVKASRIEFDGHVFGQNATFTGKIYANNIIGENSSFVQSSWNSLSKSIKIDIVGLQTYENNVRTSLLDGTGHRFYKDSRYIGKIGTAGLHEYPDLRGLNFQLSNNAHYMSWSHKQNVDDPYYTIMFAWYKNKQADTEKGFVFSDNLTLRPDSNLYVRTLSTVNYKDGNRHLQLQNSSWGGYKGVSITRSSSGAQLFLAQTVAALVNKGNAYIEVGEDSTGNYVQSIDIYNRRYTSTTQMVRVTNKGVLGMSTSSRRYKLLEEVIETDYAKKILSLDVKTWYDKQAVEDYAFTLETGQETEKEPIRRLPGIIAEDVHDVGLNMFVTYDDEGRPDGVSSNLWTLLIPIVRNNNKDIVNIKKTIELLIENNNNLMLKVAELERELEKYKN